MEKGTTINVLDHGYVKYIGSMGSDESIVEAARMSTGRGFISWEAYVRCKRCGHVWSNPKNMNPSTIISGSHPETGGACLEPCAHTEEFPNGDMGLLDNLWRNKHATPFEMCELAIEVQAPIFVFREWHRHRTQSYNEFSARYAQMPDLHYLPTEDRIQKQSSHNKQGSAETTDHNTASQILAELERQQEDIYGTYDAWVESGIAKEVARINTPVSRYSKMRAKTDLRNWLAFLNLRMRPGAQWEIREYANAVGKIIKNLWPRSWSLFEEYDLYGAHLSRTELQVLQGMLGGTNKEGRLKNSFLVQGLSGTKLKEFIKKLEKGGLEIL